MACLHPVGARQLTQEMLGKPALAAALPPVPPSLEASPAGSFLLVSTVLQHITVAPLHVTPCCIGLSGLLHRA